VSVERPNNPQPRQVACLTRGLRASSRMRAKIEYMGAEPRWIEPMLATLTHRRFSREGWIFEPKFDGERCLAFRWDGHVHLYSRNRKQLDRTYPELLGPLRDQNAESFIVDGEVVAFEGEVTSFRRLQRRMQIRDARQALATNVPVRYYIFDLLYLNGRDLTREALIARKRLLEKTVRFADPLRFTAHRETEGEAYYAEACKKGWEGLIAKRADSEYVAGRSRDWLKFKCTNQQEFVIGGYTDPRGAREEFGALLVGYYDRGGLRYAGKVGTGYTGETLRSLGKRLASLKTGASPFADTVRPRHGVHWVQPRLVAEVAFTEWTGDGKLRHPRFLGLRTDKAAEEVVREG
jgi:bifunctional non-homologous end joining protein LigD